jgi:alginate O-acetyltransferase complex protein AlgJ
VRRLWTLRQWIRPARFPALLGAGVLVISWFYLSWNATIGEAIPTLRFRTNQTVAGVFKEAAPNLTIQALLSYKFQTHVSHTIGTLSPLYKPAIRWKNQIYYSVFGMSGSPNVIVGRDRQLFQKAYLDDYCSRDLKTFTPKAEAWAAKLREMQAFFEARGTTFLYVITPSKPAVYPEMLPSSFSCPASPYDQTHKIAVYRQILDREGVHYVDAATLTADARRKYEISMFPRGGIHWNRLAASIAAQAVTDEVNRLHGSTILTPFTFSYKRSFSPQGSDRDLIDILNLVWSDSHYEVPVVSHQSSERDDCRPARITEVGGSFLFELDDALAQIACPPQISDYFYWDMKHFRYPGGTAKPMDVDAGERTRSLLQDLDVMIFEENEAALPESPHGQELLQMIAAQASTTASR